jgi:mono/diheme cytochrome c family protein
MNLLNRFKIEPVTLRLILVLMLAGAPFIIGMLFTFDILKIEWISFMEIQPSYRVQEDPLPLPVHSIPIQGEAAPIALGAPANPVPGDEVSLKRGQQLYQTNCALCHGPEGKGNGPVAASLSNKPANLTQGNAKNNSDGALFVTITNGINGRMPSMIENLPTARERWDVINYVRQLQQQAGQ